MAKRIKKVESEPVTIIETKDSPKKKNAEIKVVKAPRSKEWETDRSRRKAVLERKIANTKAHVMRCPHDKFGHQRLALLRYKLASI